MAKALGQCSKSFCGILAPKLGKARKICKSAADHHEERDYVHPVAQAHDERMLVDCAGHD